MNQRLERTLEEDAVIAIQPYPDVQPPQLALSFSQSPGTQHCDSRLGSRRRHPRSGVAAYHMSPKTTA